MATPTPQPSIINLGQLKASGWQSRSIKDELRYNLIAALKTGQTVFEGVLGYEDSVLPQLQSAILARHSILLLGLRGQAKTRIARSMVHLLDEWMPVVQGSELNDDPYHPMSFEARRMVAVQGDSTPISWVHRSRRFTEKLATPDVTVADLIGDLDPIKAANQKISFADERAIHYGLIPRANRHIFVLNELPDLQARIQVSLFNILQEGDIQIRGFNIRLNPDIQFVFTANPEDYTNRGSIVTPLKDRIQSQILTHYPRSIETAQRITAQEARLAPEQTAIVHVPELLRTLVEQVAFEARESEYVDQKSGVSARFSITALEQLIATAELRALVNNEPETTARVADLFGILPALTGKVELVYEGEQEGPLKVAQVLIGKAINKQFLLVLPDPAQLKKKKLPNPYEAIVDWFNAGNTVDILRSTTRTDYHAALNAVPGLRMLLEAHYNGLTPEEEFVYMEFLLHGLSDTAQLSRFRLETGISFRDMLGGLLSNVKVNPNFGKRKDDDDEEAYEEDDPMDTLNWRK